MKPARTTLSRRDFLSGAGAGIVILSGGVTTGCNVLFAPDARAVATALTGLLHHHDLARDLGRIYVASHVPLDDRSLEPLTRTLLDSLDIDLDEVMLLPVARLIKALAGRLRDDFANGRVAAVDGWLLSQAEARVCAIAYFGDGAA